jgi:hypothetical protein
MNSKLVTYILGFGVGAACIVYPLVTHAAANNTVALIIFGVALIVAMILVVRWNKAGKLGGAVSGTGGSSGIQLEDNQLMIVLGIGAGGLVLALVAHFLIPA